MRKLSVFGVAKILFIGLISAHIAVLGYYLYGRYGLDAGALFSIGRGQAMAEDKVKVERAVSLDDLKAFEILEGRKRELDTREEAVKSREQEIAGLKKDIEEKLGKLSQLQEQVQKDLETIKQYDDSRLKHLIGAYSAMKPNKAAELIEKLDDEVALRILSSMKSKDVGGVMSFMGTDKAAKLSQRLARHAR